MEIEVSEEVSQVDIQGRGFQAAAAKAHTGNVQALEKRVKSEGPEVGDKPTNIRSAIIGGLDFILNIVGSQ